MMEFLEVPSFEQN